MSDEDGVALFVCVTFLTGQGCADFLGARSKGCGVWGRLPLPSLASGSRAHRSLPDPPLPPPRSPPAPSARGCPLRCLLGVPVTLGCSAGCGQAPSSPPTPLPSLGEPLLPAAPSHCVPCSHLPGTGAVSLLGCSSIAETWWLRQQTSILQSPGDWEEGGRFTPHDHSRRPLSLQAHSP